MRLRLVSLLLAGALLGAVGASPQARAHEVETSDGHVYEGKILRQDDEEIVILTTFEGRKVLRRADVRRVDDRTPPLRDQLVYRADQAKDSVGELWKLHAWAKKKGFEPELVEILQRILVLAPENTKAHKLLGHEMVEGEWLTPEEKEAREIRAHEEAMRAKGLVPYEGRWVTPEEKDGLESGKLKDGSEWVTEEEYHLRRGEERVDGRWVRIGVAEGEAWLAKLREGRNALTYHWGPNVDVYSDADEEVAQKTIDGAEAVFAVFRRTLRPDGKTYPKGLEGRLRLHVFAKQPAYARFVQWFDGQEKCSELVPGWPRAAQRQHAFWWVQPVGVVGAYKFPNTTRTVVSNAVHNMAFVLLTRFRFNHRFPDAWLLEGFAYYLEMEAYGYSDTFNLHRQGTAAANASGAPVWIDTNKWPDEVKRLVADGLDPPLKRIAQMSSQQLGYPELAKSWSVVTFLVRHDAEKFRLFLEAAKNREKTTEQALQEAYGWSWQALDQRWRDHVTGDVQPSRGAEGGAE